MTKEDNSNPSTHSCSAWKNIFPSNLHSTNKLPRHIVAQLENFPLSIFLFKKWKNKDNKNEFFNIKVILKIAPLTIPNFELQFIKLNTFIIFLNNESRNVSWKLAQFQEIWEMNRWSY